MKRRGKRRKIENFQDFRYPEWHHLISKASNGDGEGSAVVSRQENIKGKSFKRQMGRGALFFICHFKKTFFVEIM